jgi:hypothetical protein
MMTLLIRLISMLAVFALAACGGGGGGASPFGGDAGGGTSGGGTGGTPGSPTIAVALSSTSVSSANPATVTATLKDAKGNAIGGQVVTFSVARGLAVTNVATALTNGGGTAVVVLSPASTAGAGADEVTASATLSGASITATTGFTVQATNVTISSFTPALSSLGFGGQTSLTLGLTGASVGAPVQLTVTSACVTAGKATLSPSKFTATTATVTLQYLDNGCGAILASDSITAFIDGTTQSLALSPALTIAAPAVSSVAFISATPQTIFLKGSGFTEASTVVFQVRDGNNNPLPNVSVSMHLLTLTGGVTIEGGTADVVRNSDANGQVPVRVNSGTLPTPVRVSATIVGTSISTVSSNLSVAVGLPSQLNFSLSQGTKNIEGYNIDGTPNTYQIIAADRSGNPVPNGTSINFVAEGGQVEPIKQTVLVNGIARTTANFVSSEPRPVDGRVTITAYALGEESFIDLNGNNVYDPGEPFQDLGNIFKDRNFDGIFDPTTDEYIPLAVNNTSACSVSNNGLLALDASIPSVPGTCDGVWSGAGQVYVRRATETVLSTSNGRPLWSTTSGLDATCSKVKLQTGPETSTTGQFTVVAGDTWYGGASGALNFIAADANPGTPKDKSQWADQSANPVFNPLTDYVLFPRLNPMAAGTTVSATTPTTGLSVLLGGGSPIPSTTEASLVGVAYSFTDASVNSGIIFVTFRSPSGLATTFGIGVVRGTRPSSCPVP